MRTMVDQREETEIQIDIAGTTLRGDLTIPSGATGLVVFAHGSGSGRKSSRNRFVAQVLQEHHLGTLLFDLLSLEEERVDARTGHLRFDIAFLAKRLTEVTEWVGAEQGWPALGFFGASTGAAAALLSARALGSRIKAVVSRGGRPDLAGPAVGLVSAPTLLLVGGEDHPVIELNERAFHELQCTKRMDIIPGATHLFEEPGTLEEVSELAADWFARYLREG